MAAATAGDFDGAATRVGGVVALVTVSPAGARGAGIWLPGGVEVAAISCFALAQPPSMARADRVGAARSGVLIGA